MESHFFREQQPYTLNDLANEFDCSEEDVEKVISSLRDHKYIRLITKQQVDDDLTDMLAVTTDNEQLMVGADEVYYVFTFVGVIMLPFNSMELVLKVLPKYVIDESKETRIKILKQILKVLRVYKADHEYYSESSSETEEGTFNLLSLILFLMQDYFENGAYCNEKEIVEINGMGEILWDKTVNNTFPIISNGHPYYTELYTRKKLSDDSDYFRRLHECILTACSEKLKENDLTDLFEMVELDLTEEVLSDFGDKDYILYRLENERRVQFNTRKQRVLTAMIDFLELNRQEAYQYSITFFGTNSFNMVWEKVCAQVFNNVRDIAIKKIPLPNLEKEPNKQIKLGEIIEKPKWTTLSGQEKVASSTLIPDIISIFEKDSEYHFYILDAKYYNLQLEDGKPLMHNPGIDSITKQYLYLLAFKDFNVRQNIKASHVKNCFLFPKETGDFELRGRARLDMMDSNAIEIWFLPADKMFDYYLTNKLWEKDWLEETY